ncbi:phage tail protein [Pseudomonas lopnurensis]|uniref:phage tail protein n=1 Tax=Pseudomonas lopnurensis TaxID=1477517 RepID=UPI0018794DC3|nr:tail fiber protein [Pseudomonas lopnurensis]MBE7373377.1 phage tail protein [Pseudomonas lopnurensis]
MSTESYLGSISGWAPSFAPRGWAFCAGQTMSIAQYSALFSLLGVAYGGDGQTTFKLPDLRGRVPIGQGQSPGTSNYDLGQSAGVESVTLTLDNLPAHTHVATGTVAASLPVSSALADTATPDADHVLAAANGASGRNPVTVNIYAPAPGTVNLPLTASANITVDPTGNNAPFSVLQPYTVINYIICIEGYFPSRN